MENPGIDPGTSRMLSERSTMSASSPMNNICKINAFIRPGASNLEAQKDRNLVHCYNKQANRGQRQ